MSSQGTLYTGIVLYSTVAPEAEAMLVVDDAIAWIGSEDSAVRLHSDAQRIDAEGMLITPTFVDVLATADGSAPSREWLSEAYSRGISAGAGHSEGDVDGVRIHAPVAHHLDYLSLSAAGTPFAFGSGGSPIAADPWTWVKAASHDAPVDQRLSARAAFLASSRGGRRVLGEMHPGALAVGVEATFAVWEPWDLTVHGSHENVDRFSTDPRSRTPLLPDLTAGAPRCLQTVVRGDIVHDALADN